MIALAIAALLPAEIGIGWTNGWVREWCAEVPGLSVADSRRIVAPGLERVVRRWTWNGEAPLEEVTLSVCVRVDGSPRALKPYIPGILMYGNPSNAGRTDGRVPVFSGEDGEFAIFEEHRLPMPFALLEDIETDRFAAMHVLPSPVRGAARDDLWWSLGVETSPDGRGTDIVALSGPIGYNRRRSVAKANQRRALAYDRAYMTLRPGDIVEKTFWVETGVATGEAFGMERAVCTSMDIFRPYYADRFAPFREIVKSKRDFAATRWIEGPAPGACGFSKYDLRAERRWITMGWTGCAATCGYALPVLNLDGGDWQKAQRSLDFVCDAFYDTVQPTGGLFCVSFDMKTGRKFAGDPVSCGQGLYSVLKAIRFAEGKGRGRLDATKWRAFALKEAGAMAREILRDDWHEPESAGPGFMVAPLVAASEIFRRDDFLAAAERIAGTLERLYFGRERTYWGGTLDAKCEDKEGAYAAFQGYEALLRHAVAAGDAVKERRYARLARHAMYAMLSYTMVWDSSYPPGRLSDNAFKSTGWTVVSAQNQHLDAFGVLATPEIWRMGEYIGDERLKKLASVMFRTCFQLTSADGSLGEQIQHTNFAQRGEMDDVSRLRGGYVEKWTVFWLTAHFLNAAAQFSEMGVEL